jgi:hypothetical protein
VVGLHPDEATEPLVITALGLGLDFCVIPCCVFAASFPHRRLKDGTEPSSYQQFLGFLREQDDRVREDRLRFQGKNIVLFLNQRADNTTESIYRACLFDQSVPLLGPARADQFRGSESEPYRARIMSQYTAPIIVVFHLHKSASIAHVQFSMDERKGKVQEH